MTFFAAFALGLAVYWALDLGLSRRPTAVLAEYRGREGGILEQFGAWLAKRFPFSLKRIREDLTWAQRAGYLKNVTAYRVLGEAAVMTAFGYLALFLVVGIPKGLAWFLPLLLTYYPILKVRNRASRAKRLAKRQLPELATVMAAELAAGASPDLALERAAQLSGPLHRFIAEAVEQARKTGRPLFSRPPAVGMFLDYARKFSRGVPEILMLAVQLDMVARKGTQGAFLMSEIARAMAREYRTDVMARAKKLDSQLVLAAAIFYFMPFVGFLLWVLGAPVFSMFASP